MIKTHLFNKANNEIIHDVQLDNIQMATANKENLLWIDLYDYDNVELQQLAQLFDFHELTIEDCLAVDTRPKMDMYKNYSFFVFHAAVYKEYKDTEITTETLNIFVGDHYVITVHKQKLKWLAHMEMFALKDTRFMSGGADLLLHTIIDGITDEYFPVLDRIRSRIDELEDTMYDYPAKKITDEFLALKRSIILIRQTIMPQRRIFSMVSGKWQFPVHEVNEPFFKDLNDHLERIVDSTETHQELVNSALDTYYSIISAKSIDKLNILTVISTIMLPLSVIASFFGMNVPLPFQDEWWSTIVITAGLGVFTYAMWKYFTKMVTQ
ncbi:magnesium transporter CorA family protein [Kurthia sibirica]|uniref:Magnesium transporter n=1 Tax=Kurthia sibirica TaxID=202750 RepID=A0A2U3APU0_9BACL|nr:magnesium transporter CorA family protein [Kurthia sibirica]PWI26526.1 magnesium transporter [Kurthia sibirica]GEK32770.1 magnesium transport protein CorA [Kurthia sibirica]